MEQPQDYRELLELFTAHHVDYVIVGAFALGHYGSPRYTGDMDVLVRPDLENGERVCAALKDFGFGSLEFTAADFANPDVIVQLGVPPIRIDILASITGVSWDEIAANREPGTFDGVAVHYIGKAQFVRNKRATGRPKDLGDLDTIGEL